MNLSELFIRRPVADGAAECRDRRRRRHRLQQDPGRGAAELQHAGHQRLGAACRRAAPRRWRPRSRCSSRSSSRPSPACNVISSSNTLGATSVTLEFDQGRDIDAAAVDVQAALLRAQRQLPHRHDGAAVVPQGQPGRLRRCCFIAADLAVAEPVGPERLRRAPDLADACRRSTASRRSASTARSASPCACASVPDALRGAQHQPRRADRGAQRRQRQHAGRHARRPQQTLTLQANRQLRNAAEFAELIVSSKGGNTVRLREVAHRRGQLRDRSRPRPRFNGETLDLARRCCASRTPTPSRSSTRCAPRCRISSRSCRNRCACRLVNDRSVSIRDALHDVTADDARHDRAGGAGDLPVPAPLRRDR